MFKTSFKTSVDILWHAFLSVVPILGWWYYIANYKWTSFWNARILHDTFKALNIWRYFSMGIRRCVQNHCLMGWFWALVQPWVFGITVQQLESSKLYKGGGTGGLVQTTDPVSSKSLCSPSERLKLSSSSEHFTHKMFNCLALHQELNQLSVYFQHDTMQ